MRYLLCLFLCVLLGGMMPTARADDGPAVPKDAMWTISCMSFTGPFRVEMAKRKIAAAKNITGVKDYWYVIHQEEESTLFYGYYTASPLRDVQGGDPKEVKRAQEDFAKIRSLRDTDGQLVFPLSYPAEIPRPGSEGNPKWDLKNTPTDRYWSILIIEYRDNPERKKAAAEAVRVLREEEKVEAYYLHLPTASRVCVGAWPRSAIKEQESDVASQPDDPNTVVKVYNFPLPKNAVTDYYENGKHVRVFAPKIEILDPNMQRAVDKYPYFYINGQNYAKRVKDPNGKERLVPDSSLFQIIPHNEAAIGGGEKSPDKSVDAQPPVSPRPLGPPPAPVPAKPRDPTPGAGRLKSLD